MAWFADFTHRIFPRNQIPQQRSEGNVVEKKSASFNKHIFICYASQNKNWADEICNHLEQSGIRCWIAPRDILPGTSYLDEILNAVRSSAAFLLVWSLESNQSPHVVREVAYAIEQNIPIFAVEIERVKPSKEMSFFFGKFHSLDISNKPGPQGLNMVRAFVSKVPGIGESSAPVIPRASETKGYVFISYHRADSDFVVNLKDILKRRGYAYWDYSESERDYHSALYKELEEKIENAKAFMCIVTDSWRESEWPAAEYIYAKEAKVPVFVIHAKKLKRPVPIIINQQTRIDMATDFETGVSVLDHELDKKGL